jgi:hypothetical protein
MNTLFKTFHTLSVLALFSVAEYAYAAPQEPGPPSGTPPGGSGLSYKLNNPLGFDTLQEFIVTILGVIITIATPIVVLFIIFAGFQYVTARGEPGKIKSATQALTYAVIGGLLILGAKVIAEIIQGLVTSFSAA